MGNRRYTRYTHVSFRHHSLRFFVPRFSLACFRSDRP
jgi:hypothetical protein